MTNWYPRATSYPGPSVKIQTGRNPAAGVVLHSMVGFRAGAHSVLENVEGPRKTVAWHFSVLQDGTVEQHYPIDVILHHAGNRWANEHLIGIEHEGGFDPPDEPLTTAQQAASVELVRWIAEQRSWTPARTGDKTLYEHNEVSDTSTQCPSGRIPWPAYSTNPLPALPPPAGPLDWGTFYMNGAKPVRVERRNPTSLTYVYEVHRFVKG